MSVKGECVVSDGCFGQDALSLTNRTQLNIYTTIQTSECHFPCHFTSKHAEYLYPGNTIPTPKQLFFILWPTLTSGVKAPNRPTTKAVLFGADTREGLASFGIQSFQSSPRAAVTSYQSLSWAPVLNVSKVLPKHKGEMVSLIFFDCED